jgi:hypothetical protein
MQGTPIKEKAYTRPSLNRFHVSESSLMRGVWAVLDFYNDRVRPFFEL